VVNSIDPTSPEEVNSYEPEFDLNKWTKWQKTADKGRQRQPFSD
jgi:hypothetical protein